MLPFVIAPADIENIQQSRTQDEMLAWQTELLLSLETGRDGHVVHLRPEQVVEIAFDGVQRSSRYSGGVALRFARCCAIGTTSDRTRPTRSTM